MPSFRLRLVLSSFLFLISSTALATSAVVVAPSSDEDGNYVVTVSWTVTGSNYPISLKYYEKVGSGSYQLVASGNNYTTYTASDKPDGVYRYYVNYCYSGGPPYYPTTCNNSSSKSVTVARPQPPGVPVLSAPTSDTDGSYTVSWTAPIGATSYALERRFNSGSWSSLQSSSATSRSESGLADGTWGYRVRACNSGGCSGWSAIKSVTVLRPPVVPGAISGPSNDPDGSFSISWDSVASATSYTLQRRLDGGSWSTVQSSSATSRSESGLADGTWGYRVRACNSSGCSGYGATKTTTVLHVPDTPGLSAPASDSDGSYTVSWTAPVGGSVVDSYELEEKVGSGNWTQVYSGTNSKLSFSGKAENNYHYRARACNGSGCGGYTSQQTVGVWPTHPTNTLMTPEPASSVGSTPFNAYVDPKGNANITIPLWVAPGVNGMQPALTVNYNSAASMRSMVPIPHTGGLYELDLPGSLFVYGWRISGLSEIRRCTTGKRDEFPHPENVYRRPALQFDNTDNLCLDGEELVLVAGQHLTVGARYRTKTESYRNIEIRGSSSAPWFEVRQPEGHISTYGKTANARVQREISDTDPTLTPPFIWAIDSITDAFGNVMTYDYEKREVYYNEEEIKIIKPYVTYSEGERIRHWPVSIHYGSNTVEFAYDWSRAYPALNSILINGGLREYTLFGWVHQNKGKAVSGLQECAQTEHAVRKCLPELDFDYAPVEQIDHFSRKELIRITDGLGAQTEFDYTVITHSHRDNAATVPHSFAEAPDVGAETGLSIDVPLGQTFVGCTQSTGQPTYRTRVAGSIHYTGAAANAVTAMRRSNGVGGFNTVSYKYYGNGWESCYGRGFNGYPVVRAIDQNSGRVTYGYYHVTDELAGQLIATSTWDDNYGQHSQLLAYTEYDHRLENITWQINGGNATTGLPVVDRVLNLNLLAGSLIGGSILTNTYTFDNEFIGTTQAHTETGSALAGDPVDLVASSVVNTTIGTRMFDNFYYEDALNSNPGAAVDGWRIGFLNQETVQYFNGAVGGTNVDSKTQTVLFTPYNKTMENATETLFPSDSDNELTITYAYDTQGHPTSATVLGAHVASRTVTASGFGQSSDFPENTYNALNHRTQVLEYDQRFKTPKRVSDPNGLQTTHLSDAFGRTALVEDIDGVTATIDYALCMSAVCATVSGATPSVSISPVLVKTSTTSTGFAKKDYYDELGRSVRQKTLAFDGSWLVVDTQYDENGRIHGRSLPYLEGATPQFVVSTYDVLTGRRTRVDRPDGGYSIAQYQTEGGAARVTATEHVVNPGGPAETRQKVSYFNAAGQLTHTYDAYGTAKQIKTAFQYDALGNADYTQINDDPATATSMVFDHAGRRTGLTSPDFGIQQTRYTALGQIRWTRDAKGTESSFAYDLLDRVTSKTITGDAHVAGTHTWVYDPVGAKGLLDYTTDNDGFTEIYRYNDPSRAARLSGVETTITVPGFSPQTFTRDFTYDGAGRLQDETSPSGFVTTTTFNARGYPAGLYANSTALAEVTQVGAFGVTEASYFNSATKSVSFDPQSGRAERIRHHHAAVNIDDLSYTWRSDGSLHSRDNLSGASDTFAYDVLERLDSTTNVTSHGQVTLSNGYDATGNLTSKTSSDNSSVNVTGYQYGTGSVGQVGPNTLVGATLDGANYAFEYDANGAIVKYDYLSGGSGEDKHIAYNGINQPAIITVGSSLTVANPTARDEIRYNPYGDRYYKKTSYTDGGSTKTEHAFYVGNYELTYYDASHALQWTETTQVGDIQQKITQPDTGSSYETLQVLHRDHLGSIVAITDNTLSGGSVVQRMAFDPFGSRRNTDWHGDLSGIDLSTLIDGLPSSTTRGYTGHEMLDRTGFVHMNGRVYDPALGRFLSPDPIVKNPVNSQSWNRFAYVANNPLSATDPTGYQSDYDLPHNSMAGTDDYERLLRDYYFSNDYLFRPIVERRAPSHIRAVTPETREWHPMPTSLWRGAAMFAIDELTLGVWDYTTIRSLQKSQQTQADIEAFENSLGRSSQVAIILIGIRKELVAGLSKGYLSFVRSVEVPNARPRDSRGRFTTGAGGDSAEAAAGREAHDAFDETVRAKPGWQSRPRIVDADSNVHIPDALSPSGRPVELKPNTPSGRKAGQRQLRRYEEVTGKKGRVVYYDAE